MASLVEEVEQLDHRGALHATAKLLAQAITVAAEQGKGTLAQEVAQLRQTLAELRELPDPTAVPKGGPNVFSADEARAARAQRIADAKIAPVTKKAVRKRG